MTPARNAPAAKTDAPLDDMTRRVARAAVRSLWHELVLYPKPGLVSLHDAGAHDDMNADTFIRSLFALSRFFGDIAKAGAAGAGFETLRVLGIHAERAMLTATRGVNTHRGAIFALGLLCATVARTVAAREAPTDAMLRKVLLSQWGADLASLRPAAGSASHGLQAKHRHGATGARGEALHGFPSVFEVALPALREALARDCDMRHARLSAFFALLAHVDDTNVLHRGGAKGLAFVRRVAREFRASGDVQSADAVMRAEAIHRAFIARRLSPGGCADLLAAALFVHDVQHMLR
jgi:triphosphoribosyl-dephospho-CoA synthase